MQEAENMRFILRLGGIFLWTCISGASPDSITHSHLSPAPTIEKYKMFPSSSPSKQKKGTFLPWFNHNPSGIGHFTGELLEESRNKRTPELGKNIYMIKGP